MRGTVVRDKPPDSVAVRPRRSNPNIRQCHTRMCLDSEGARSSSVVRDAFTIGERSDKVTDLRAWVATVIARDLAGTRVRNT